MEHGQQRLHQRIREGKTALGITIADVQMVELAAHLGFDWFMIDQMFTSNDWSKTQDLVRAGEAYGITPCVRVQSNPWLGYDHRVGVEVSRALGIGAEFVFFSPSGRQEIEECAQVSHSWHRRGTTIHPFNSFEEWTSKTNEMYDGTYVVPQPESDETLNDLPGILDIPEVKMVFVAMTDASKVLTESDRPDWYSPLLWTRMDEAIKHANEKGKVIGANTSYAYTMDELAKRVLYMHERGVRVIMIQAATFLFQVAIGGFLRDLKSEIAEK